MQTQATIQTNSKVGAKFKVLKGNKTIGLAMRATGRVREITEVRDAGVRVVLEPARGPKVVVWARYLKTLERSSFNLGCGDGINHITIVVG
jgi:hypothetical protein